MRKKGPFLIVAILIIFGLLHLSLNPSDYGKEATGATLIGGMAYLLMTCSIFLSTRPKYLEDAFGGLDRIYQVHKTCGVNATLLVLLHFFIAPKNLPTEFNDQIINTIPSSPMGMLAMIALVISIGISLNRKIAYHKWRLPHKAMGIIYILITAHMITTPTALFDNLGASGLMLMAASLIGVVSYFYSILGFNNHSSYNYIIEEVHALERTTELVMKPVAQKMTHKAGQFAFIEIEDKEFSEPHPFTISSAPTDKFMRFTIRVSGDWTRKIREELKPGGKVCLRGPYGRFDCNAAGDRQIWLAGGVGITPFMSTLREMKADDPREIILFYSVRKRDEAVYLDEITKIMNSLSNAKLILLESNLEQYVNAELIKEKLGKDHQGGRLNDYEYFICGPKPLLKNVTQGLKKEGVSKHKIHTEAFEFR